MLLFSVLYYLTKIKFSELEDTSYLKIISQEYQRRIQVCPNSIYYRLPTA